MFSPNELWFNSSSPHFRKENEDINSRNGLSETVWLHLGYKCTLVKERWWFQLNVNTVNMLQVTVDFVFIKT